MRRYKLGIICHGIFLALCVVNAIAACFGQIVGWAVFFGLNAAGLAAGTTLALTGLRHHYALSLVALLLFLLPLLLILVVPSIGYVPYMPDEYQPSLSSDIRRLPFGGRPPFLYISHIALGRAVLFEHPLSDRYVAPCECHNPEFVAGPLTLLMMYPD